jgi:hypothetical protein
VCKEGYLNPPIEFNYKVFFGHNALQFKVALFLLHTDSFVSSVYCCLVSFSKVIDSFETLCTISNMHLTQLLTIAFRLRTPHSWLQAIDAESCTGDNGLAEGDSAIPDKFFIKLERFLKHEHQWTWYVIF